MKVKELFEVSSLIADETFNDDFYIDKEVDYNALMFNPVGIQIDPESQVSLVQNASVIKTDTWNNIIDLINDEWDNLNGHFIVAQAGMVIHQFTVSH